MTTEYQYIVNHTPEGERIQTLVKLSDRSGLEAVRSLDAEVHTTTEPTVAAYATLTPAQATELAGVESVTKLAFSPGSNPFWRLEGYTGDVFPPVSESVDFIDYEQLLDGMSYLEERNPDRLRFYSIGESPGHYNFVLQAEDPKGIQVAEVTNDVHDEASFEEKEKVVYSLSIHGDERAGTEAGTRFVEDLLDGEEERVEQLLDEIVLIFVYPNPDGWVARYPQYNDDGEGYQRGTAGVEDPNRSYPTVGWIDGTHYPAEPDGSDLSDDDPGIDSDVATPYTEHVPDSLAIVEHLRGYENLSYGTDLHGKGPSADVTEGLLINDEFGYEELHDLYELNRVIGERHEATLDSSLDELADVYATLEEKYEEDVDVPAPDSTYDYGTVYDTLEYSTTGILISWMAQPEEQGGLGMTVQANEVTVYGDEFLPTLVAYQVQSYVTVIRTFAEHAVDDVEATIDTDGQSTAVVRSDSLTRSSDQLQFVDPSELPVPTAEGSSVVTGEVLDPEGDGDRRVATPDPRGYLEYDQRTYEVTPFDFFGDASEFVVDGGGFAHTTVEAVREGALEGDGSDGPTYDNLVVIHDEGVDDGEYLDAIDAFVEAGGNLVLTDAGVGLLGHLENDLASGIDPDDVTTESPMFAVFESDHYPHPLLRRTRPYQDELWKLSPIGYAITEEGEAPMTLVDQAAFRGADGDVAATTNERVAAGSIVPGDTGEDGGTADGIHVVGSLLPPASQVHLHPFGMVDYTVSFFGTLVLTNALDYRQCRYVNGDLIETFGTGDSVDAEGETGR
jgi:hypothetical protein